MTLSLTPRDPSASFPEIDEWLEEARELAQLLECMLLDVGDQPDSNAWCLVFERSMRLAQIANWCAITLEMKVKPNAG